MKTIALACLFFSLNALADSSINCKLEGGSEQILSMAPKTFDVNESDSLTLRVNEKMLMEIEVGSGDSIYYGSQDLSISTAASRVLISEGNSPVNGLDIIKIKGCQSGETTTATYSFGYRKNKMTVSAGLATYNCECSLD